MLSREVNSPRRAGGVRNSKSPRRQRSLALASALAVLLALLATPTTSAAARDLLGTRATAMGGALRASASGPSSVLLNPAGMSLARMYVISALYQYRGSDSASQLSAAVVDSATSGKIAAGLFYNFTTASPNYLVGASDVEQTDKTHEIGVALSMPLGKWLVLGVSTRYINVSSGYNEGAPAALPVAADISTLTMDVGGIIRLGKSINLGVVGYNLIPVDKTYSNLFPQSLGLGVAFSLGTLALFEFDTVLDFSTDPDPDSKVAASYHGGAELFLAKRYAFRGGAAYDSFRQATYITGGVGLVSKRLGVEFGLRQQVDGGSETLLTFSLNLFVTQ